MLGIIYCVFVHEGRIDQKIIYTGQQYAFKGYINLFFFVCICCLRIHIKDYTMNMLNNRIETWRCWALTLYVFLSASTLMGSTKFWFRIPKSRESLLTNWLVFLNLCQPGIILSYFFKGKMTTLFFCGKSELIKRSVNFLLLQFLLVAPILYFLYLFWLRLKF